MQFTCNRNNIVRAVGIVERAAVSHEGRKELEGIYALAEDNQIKFFATDGEFSVEARIDADVQSSGDAVLDGKVFGQIVRKLSGENVTYETEPSGLVKITSDRSRFSLHTMAKDEYPDIPPTPDKPFLRISEALLRRMIRKTIFSVAVDDSRPFLTGVFVRVEGNTICFVSTDSSRLSFHSGDLPTSAGEPVSAIIPARTLSELSRILKDDDESEVEFYIGTREIVFRFNGIEMTSRLIEGRFPDYERALEPNQVSKMVLPRQSLLEAVERVSLVAKRSAPVIEFALEDGVVVLNSKEAEVGEATEHIEVEQQGEAGKASYQARFIMDVLRVLESDTIRMELGEGLRQGRIVGTEEDNYTYIVMPVRVG